MSLFPKAKVRSSAPVAITIKSDLTVQNRSLGIFGEGEERWSVTLSRRARVVLSYIPKAVVRVITLVFDSLILDKNSTKFGWSPVWLR